MATRREVAVSRASRQIDSRADRDSGDPEDLGPPPRLSVDDPGSAHRFAQWATRYEEQRRLSRRPGSFDREEAFGPIVVGDAESRQCAALEQERGIYLVRVGEKGEVLELNRLDQPEASVSRAAYGCRFEHPDRKFSPFRLVYSSKAK